MLAVPEQDVVNMNRRLAAPDHSLNAPVRMDSEGEWQDWLVDESESQETAIAEREELTGRKALLGGALKTLNERERHILIERRLKDNPTTLEELSQQYGISRERVRQIEVRAFEKLQKAMKAQIAERRLAAQPSGLGLNGESSPASGSREGAIAYLAAQPASSFGSPRLHPGRQAPFRRATGPLLGRRACTIPRSFPMPAAPRAATAREQPGAPAAPQASAAAGIALPQHVEPPPSLTRLPQARTDTRCAQSV